MSNVAVFGLSLSAVTAVALTVAGVNGAFDRWIDPSPEIVAEQATGNQAAEAPAKVESVDTDVAATDPVPSEETVEEADAIMPTKKPTVDIVRVEPSGDAVIAGQSDAGALVAVLSNSVLVGKGVANDAGDWAIVIDDPLAPGPHDIIVEARRNENTEPVQAEIMISVNVPEDESDGVLVATNTPGAPTEVLQVPDQQKTIVADLVENGATTQDPSGESDSTVETPVAAPAPEAEEDPDTIVTADSASSAETVGEEPQSVEAESEPIVVASTEPDPAPVADQTNSAAPNSTTGTHEVTATERAAAQPSAESAEPAEPTAQAPQAEKPEETVIAKVDEAETAEQPAAEPAEIAIATPEQDAESEKVAKLNVEPADSRPEPVEAKPEPAEAKPETVEAKAEPVEAKSEPAEAKPEPEVEVEPSVTVKAVEADKGQVYVAGESSGEGAVRVYIEEKFVGQTEPSDEGQWVLKAPKDIEPGKHSVRADKVVDDRGAVTARAEVVFEREADEVALKPIVVVGSGASGVTAGADVDAGRRQIPALIIRKGDSLWRISRRHYGEGIRYTTIYEANQGQIRNPDLIFPGQVFLLPQRDLNWASN